MLMKFCNKFEKTNAYKKRNNAFINSNLSMEYRLLRDWGNFLGI